MRKPKLLLALVEGATLMAFLPLDDAAAQDLDVEITSVETFIARADRIYREARTAHQAGECDTFEFLHDSLVKAASQGFDLLLQPARIPPEDRSRYFNHAERAAGPA